MSPPLLHRLDGVRRGLRRAHLLAALARCALTALALVAAFFALDWLAVSRISEGGVGDRIARAIMAVAGLVVLAWTAGRTLVRELRTRRGDDQLAMRVERGHPRLHGRLISTVQLTRANAADPGHGSDELIAELEQDTVSATASLDFAAVVDWRALRHIGLVAIALLALALGLACWRADFARALFARLALRDAAYPTRARILDATRGGLVPSGEPFAIEVALDASRSLPPHAVAAIRPRSGDALSLTLERLPDAPSGQVRYRGVLPRALEDFSFRVAALDARWPRWEAVRVAQRPAVKALQVACEFPAYLKRQTEVGGGGDIHVPVGTTVRLRVALTVPVASATFTRRASDAPPVVAPMQLDAAGTSAEIAFTVEASGSYDLGLRDAAGIENREPIAYTITAIPDRPPLVAIRFPGQDKLATRFAKWPIRFSVREDHGIAKAWLKYAIGPAQETPAPGEQAATAPTKSGAIEITGVAAPGELEVAREVLLDLGKLGLADGARVTYWIEVADDRQPQANVGESKRYAFAVVDAATMAEQLEQERTRLVGAMETLHDKQRDVHEAVDTLRGTPGKPSP